MFRSCLAVLALTLPLHAQTKMEPGPKSPEESRRCIKVRPGFTVELMAAEPLVMDPIAFAWGPDGKFWVVEMGDYPLGAGGKDRPGGRVKFLTRSRDDGPYEKATLFLDNLGYPTGVTPWRKGVLITCAPDIFYAEDTDGDGKADRKEILYTGFGEGNQQHRVNGLVFGPDGWFYGANGDSGGMIKSLKTGAVVDIRGRDFRIKPETGAIEAVTGQSQFGRAMDNRGNWFGCNNSRPLFHFVLDDHYLRRNPHVIYPSPKVEVIPGAIEVFPISKALPRFNDYHTLNHFTSACGLTFYRDDLFGPGFASSAFISEPVHNLVHRAVLKHKGVSFTAERADDEKDREFLASTDNWFRPTMLQTGPDGALWIADMYRYVIEHPQWIPKEWQAKLDLRAGHDMGRIYRVYPEGKKPRPTPRFEGVDDSKLVFALTSPHGWTRDTAQRLLLERHENAGQDLSDELRLHLFARQVGANAFGNLHASGVLESLRVSPPGAKRRSPYGLPLRVVSAVRLNNFPEYDLRNLADQVVRHKGIDPLLRLDLAFALGELKGTGPELAKVLRVEPNEIYLQAAVWSSLTAESWPAFVEELLKGKDPTLPESWVPALVRMAHGFDRPDVTAKLLEGMIGPDVKVSRFLTLAPLLESLDFQKSASIPALRPSLEKLHKALSVARTLAADAKAPLGDRALALALLGRDQRHLDEDRKLLVAFLSPQMPDDLQVAAIARLGQMPGSEATLLKAWVSLGPTQRNHVLDALLSRPVGVHATLEALEKRTILSLEIDAARRQRLTTYRDAKVRDRAQKLFATASQPDRVKIIESYKTALADKSGDAGRGLKVFTKSCSACHQLGAVGNAVGQDLKAIGDKSAESLLVAIFDPNRAVEPRFINYVVATKSGLTVTGILAGETGTSVSLVSSDGKKHDLLRQDIDEMASTGQSLMPEGLERDLMPQDVADLFAYLQSQWSAGASSRK